MATGFLPSTVSFRNSKLYITTFESIRAFLLNQLNQLNQLNPLISCFFMLFHAFLYIEAMLRSFVIKACLFSQKFGHTRQGRKTENYPYETRIARHDFQRETLSNLERMESYFVNWLKKVYLSESDEIRYNKKSIENNENFQQKNRFSEKNTSRESLASALRKNGWSRQRRETLSRHRGHANPKSPRQVLPFLWRASGGSRNLAMLVGGARWETEPSGTWNSSNPTVFQGVKKKRWNNVKHMPCQTPRPTTAITLTTTYWRRTTEDGNVFGLARHQSVKTFRKTSKNNSKKYYKNTNTGLSQATASDFHISSFTQISPKGDQEVEPEHGRWDRRFSVTSCLSLCQPFLWM